MRTLQPRLYSLPFNNYRTYIFAALFIIGNILVPQLCHLIPQGGLHLLPIYLFTLIGAYKYGWRVGVLTAVLSPLVNNILFGMPPAPALTPILLKSILLAGIAGACAAHYKKATIPVLLMVVLSYQVVGTLGEWLLKGDLTIALQDFTLGFPGMLLQIFGGWIIINYLLRN